MKQEGIVVARQPNEASLVVVRIFRASACGHDCEACGGCPAGREELITVRAGEEIAAGDKVTLETDTWRVLGLAAVVYLLPLGLMAAGSLLGTYYGLAGLAVGFVPSFLINRRWRRTHDNLPVARKS